MKKLILLTALFGIWQSALGQDLLNERIRKLADRKKSIYLDRGIFHNGPVTTSSTLKAIRHSFSADQGFERVVFDFDTNSIPKIYGGISSGDKSISIEFFKTKLNPSIDSFGESKFIKGLDFFNFADDSLSVEMNLKQSSIVDIFYLSNPGRLVIDIKKI